VYGGSHRESYRTEDALPVATLVGLGVAVHSVRRSCCGLFGELARPFRWLVGCEW
jgi:hypothetical protein